MRIIIQFVLLLSLGAAQAETITGRVIKVTDGDTVDILDASFAKHHVRLSGIDAPEKDQPFGNRGQQKLFDLVFGQEVVFDWRKLDVHQRSGGKVLVSPANCKSCEQSIDAGLAVLQAGLAWHYKQYEREQSDSDRILYAQAEVAARKWLLGLWADQLSIPSWDWRREK